TAARSVESRGAAARSVDAASIGWLGGATRGGNIERDQPFAPRVLRPWCQEGENRDATKLRGRVSRGHLYPARAYARGGWGQRTGKRHAAIVPARNARTLYRRCRR